MDKCCKCSEQARFWYFTTNQLNGEIKEEAFCDKHSIYEDIRLSREDSACSNPNHLDNNCLSMLANYSNVDDHRILCESLSEAILRENYEEAARIRDIIKDNKRHNKDK